MKRLLLIITVLFSLQGSTQQKQTEKQIAMLTKQITSYQTNYPEKPYYTAQLQAQACYYEVFLNDIPVFSYGTTGGISNQIPLNGRLLKSGTQKLKIRLTSLFNNTILSQKVDFSIAIGFNFIKNQNELGEYVSCGTFQLPELVKQQQLPFFEVEIPFEARVPWDYSAVLENAQNLKNNSNTEALVAKALIQLHQSIAQKNQFTYETLVTDMLKRECNVMYSTRKEIRNIVLNMDLEKTVVSVYPLPKYTIAYYAGGKLVRAVNITKDEDGNRNVIKYKVPPLIEGDENDEGIGTEDYLYYLPEGKTALEIF